MSPVLSIGTPSAQNVDAHENASSEWAPKLSEQPDETFPGNSKMTSQDGEITRLRKEVAGLNKEHDLLKQLRPTSRGSQFEFCFIAKHRRVCSVNLMGDAQCIEGRFLCIAESATNPA